MRIQNYYRKLKWGMEYRRFLTEKPPYAEYIQEQLRKMRKADSCPDDADFCIITVAFNNLQYLEWQNELLERFDRNKHSQIIIDNSTDSSVSEKIREFCRERHILWIRIPENPFSSTQFLSPSTSHAAAVNYAMKHVIGKFQLRRILFLDHDIFPIKPFDLNDLIGDQNFYGRVCLCDHGRWMIWPGYLILQNVPANRINFLPRRDWRGDTGSQMYDTLYRKTYCGYYHFAHLQYAVMPYHSKQVVYQLYDGTWLHFFNGSNWDNKKEQVESKTALMSVMMKLIHNGDISLKDAELIERNPENDLP